MVPAQAQPHAVPVMTLLESAMIAVSWFWDMAGTMGLYGFMEIIMAKVLKFKSLKNVDILYNRLA